MRLPRILVPIILAIAALVAPSVTAHATRHGTVATTKALNPLSPAFRHPYRVGVVPTRSRLRQMHAYAQVHHGVDAAPQVLAYGGGNDGIGVTSGTPKVYLVFWGSQWGAQSIDQAGNRTFTGDPDQGAPYLQNLFRGIGTGGELWSGTMTQYCDGSLVRNGATDCPSSAPHVGYPTDGALAGVWYDNASAEPQVATGHQIGQEAINAAGHFGNTTEASNRYAQYDILSATGTNPDNYQTQNFCAWHDWNGDTSLSGGSLGSPYGDVAFTNMPYVMDVGPGCGMNYVNNGPAGTLDGYSIVNGHEYAETITDQNPSGGWTNAVSGEENGDECAWLNPGSGQGASANVTMGTGTFAMQSTWSNDTNECDIAHAIVGVATPSPTATATATATPSPTATATSTLVPPTATPTQPVPTPTSTATIPPPPPTPTATPKPRKHDHYCARWSKDHRRCLWWRRKRR